MKNSILIADDHPLLLQGLKSMLLELPMIDRVFVAKDGQEALEKIEMENPDLAILDIDMPLLTGLEVVQKINPKNSTTKIIFLTLHKEKTLYDEAQKLGVLGYVLKEFSLDELEKCIEIVMDGEKFVSPALKDLLEIDKKMDLSIFTKTEINIIRLISKEKTTPQIAEMLFVSPKTIENHRGNIIKKLELQPAKNSLLKWVLQHKSSLL